MRPFWPLLVAGALFALPELAHAQIAFPSADDLGLPGNFTDAATAIRTGWNAVIIVAGIIFLALFLFGGVQYLTAAGNEDASTKARHTLRDATIGIILVVLAWPIGVFVLNLLGVGDQLGVGQPSPNLSVSPTTPGSSPGSRPGETPSDEQPVALPVTIKLADNLRDAVINLIPVTGQGQAQQGVTDSLGETVLNAVPGEQYEVLVNGDLVGVRTVPRDATGSLTWNLDPETTVKLKIMSFLDQSGSGALVPNVEFEIYRQALAGPNELIAGGTSGSTGQINVQLPVGELITVTGPNGTPIYLRNQHVTDQAGSSIEVFVDR